MHRVGQHIPQNKPVYLSSKDPMNKECGTGPSVSNISLFHNPYTMAQLDEYSVVQSNFGSKHMRLCTQLETTIM